MRPTKPVLKTIAFIILVVFLSARGWSSSRDIEKRSFVMLIGVDAGLEGGYKVQYSIALPKAVGTTGGGEAGGGGEKEPVLQLTANANSLLEAHHVIQGKVDHPLFYGHLQAEVVGEELARRGVREILDAILRNAEIRRKSWFVVAEGKAEDLLKVTPKMEKLPALYMARAMEMEDYLKMIPMLRVNEFMTREANPGEEPIAIMLRPEKDTLVVSGLAVFKGDKMVGKLNATEMHHFLLAAMGRGLMPERIPSPAGDGDVTYLITGAKRSVKPYVQGNKVSLSVRVQVEGNIMEKGAGHSLRDENYLRAVEAAVAADIERDCRTVLRHFQKDFRVDSYGFGTIIRARYPKLWRELDWDKEFPDVPINIRVEAKVRRLGMAAN